MIASPPLKNQELSQPSIFDVNQDTTAEPGFLSKAEDILLEQYIATTDTSAATTRKTIAAIYILMVAQKGDRESHKYGSFNKLCESRAQVWGFSTSQCYRIGQASQQREKIRERAATENWQIGDVDEIADSVFLEMERVEEGFQQEVLEAANLDFSNKGGVTTKSLEKAINFVAERYEDSSIVAKPKQKKSSDGSGGDSNKVVELQDLLVKERQRRVELEEKLESLSNQGSDQRVAELEAHCEKLLNELDQLRASNQPNPDELEVLVNQRVEAMRQQLEAEVRRDLQAQIAEAETLRARVAQLEEQLGKVAIDAPAQELIPVKQPQVVQFWRRKENLKFCPNESRLKAADAETAYIRCDNRSSEEQIQLSLERQALVEQDLAKHQKEQRRHSPTSPLRAMHQPLIDEIQEEIAFEQQLRIDLGHQEPVATVTVEEEQVEEIVEDDEDAYTQITKDDLDQVRQFLKNNGISNKEFMDECLTPRRYDRAGLLTKQQLKEVWVELEGMAELKPINEDELQELLAFASESGISDEDFRAALLTPFRYQNASEILRCQLPEMRKALEDIIEF